ncbi:hypothetical protein F4703DRAFT_1796022 [Phycomyces blakesleeanus]
MSKSLVPPITAHHQTKPPEEPTVQCSPPETGQRCTCLEHTCQKQLSGFSSASKGHQYQTRSDKNVSKTQWDRRQKNQWLAETGKTNRTEDGYSKRWQAAIVNRERKVLMLRGDVGKMNYVHCRRGMLLAWGTMISNEYNIDEYINKGKGKSIVCRRNREWKRDFSCARKNSPLTTKGTASHQQTVDVSLS